MHRYQSQVALVALICALLAWTSVASAQGAANQGRQTRRVQSQTQQAGLRGDALIQYDPDTGSLIVVTDEETNADIKKVIEDLDRPVPQVLIKVLFLEVTHTNDLDLGLEFSKVDMTTHNFSTQVDTKTLETIFGVAGQTTGGFYRLAKEDLNLTLHALSQVAKLEVLSRPSILTANNKEATITVGQEVPFITNSRITQDGQTINTVQYTDIGIILQVTPHITEDRLVAMDVAPEISTVTGDTVPISANINAPVFAKRSATTSVVVPDGYTVVIGGLMEDNNTKSNKKIPILGDIPIIGAAFGRKSNSKTKTELLIFLTPYVVQSAEELSSMTSSEKSNSELAPKAFTQSQLGRYLDEPKKAPNGPVENLQVDSQPVENATPDVSAPTQDSTGLQAPEADGKASRRRGGNKGVTYRRSENRE